MVHEVENFYGCYLLYCTNPQYKGRTYIGFTVDPNRRIKQHNTGRHAGGAWRTSGRGPWDMVLIIHGFPNQISALRFEWAWQHPESSRRLRHVQAKKKKETPFDFRVRVVSTMLNTRPWSRMALTIQWLKQEYAREFDPDLQPPLHMPIAYGPVKAKKVSGTPNDVASNTQEQEEDVLLMSQVARTRCAVCSKRLQDDDDTLKCYHSSCSMESHTLCLAQHFLAGTDELIPLDGRCMKCKNDVLWGDLVRYKKGCYQQSAGEDAEHWTDELGTQI